MSVVVEPVDVTYRTRNNLNGADAVNDYALKSFPRMEDARRFIRTLAVDLSKAPCKTAAGAVDVKPRVASVTLNTGNSPVNLFYTLMYCPNRTAKLFDGAATGAAVSEWVIE